MEKKNVEVPTLHKPRKSSRIRNFFVGVLWVLCWPIIIGVMSLPVFFLLSLIFGKQAENGWADASGFVVRGYVVVLVVMMVLICLGFMWLKARKKTANSKISRNVLKIYMWMGIVSGILLAIALPDPQTSGANAGINVQQSAALIAPALAVDPTIVASLQRVGATDFGGIETKFVDGYDGNILENQEGQYQAFLDATGNWSYGVMTIKSGLSAQELDSIAAHEYLHHVWFKTLDEETKRRLTSDMITIYGKDPMMHKRVSSYSDKQTLQPTELFSYYCTESSDQYLTDYILAECGKYINRAALTFAR